MNLNSTNSNENSQVDYSNEVVKRMIKYLIEGLAVGLAAFLIPSKKIKQNEVLVIGLTAATVFALLDNFSPGISFGARHGAGFGLGTGLVGF